MAVQAAIACTIGGLKTCSCPSASFARHRRSHVRLTRPVEASHAATVQSRAPVATHRPAPAGKNTAAPTQLVCAPRMVAITLWLWSSYTRACNKRRHFQEAQMCAAESMTSRARKNQPGHVCKALLRCAWRGA